VTFREQVAEKVGIGFELPTQSSVVAPNAHKKVDQPHWECGLGDWKLEGRMPRQGTRTPDLLVTTPDGQREVHAD